MYHRTPIVVRTYTNFRSHPVVDAEITPLPTLTRNVTSLLGHPDPSSHCGNVATPPSSRPPRPPPPA